jgi:hypothetical protein
MMSSIEEQRQRDLEDQGGEPESADEAAQLTEIQIEVSDEITLEEGK